MMCVCVPRVQFKNIHPQYKVCKGIKKTIHNRESFILLWASQSWMGGESTAFAVFSLATADVPLSKVFYSYKTYFRNNQKCFPGIQKHFLAAQWRYSNNTLPFRPKTFHLLPLSDGESPSFRWITYQQDSKKEFA